MTADRRIEAVDEYYERKYAVKDAAELEDLLASFKDLVTSDWQLNDVEADGENYKIKQLVCTCQQLANMANDNARVMTCMLAALTCRD